jgi:hypothetical protein
MDNPLEFHIKAPEIDGDSIFVEQYDDGVWLSIAGLQARMHIVIPVAQATQLRDALDAILKAMEVAA